MIESVDVIIPTYNRASVVKRSVMSVLDQTYKNFDLYVVDDGSDDDTQRIISSIKDDRVHYIRNNQRQGANYCRNKGAAAGKSEYIAFNDSDDIWNKNKLGKQMEFMRGKKPGMVFSPYYFKNGKEEIIIGKCTEIQAANIQRTLIQGNVIGTPTICMNRYVFEQTGGFDEELPRHQDWDLALRISRQFPIYYCDEPLVTAMGGDDRISNDADAYKRSLKIIIARNADIIEKYDELSRYIKLCSKGGMSIDEVREMLLDKSGVNPDKREIILMTECFKYMHYYRLICMVIENDEKICGYFKENNIKSVAIYGNTKLSNIFADILARQNITITALIDKNTTGNTKYTLVKPERFCDEIHMDTDMVINTVPSLFGKSSDLIKGSKVIDILGILD